MLELLLQGGMFIDIALFAVLVEFVVLVVLGRLGRTRMRPLDVAGHLLAGALLLLALRVAVNGGDIVWVVALMTASLPAHLYDLWRRAAR